VKGPEDGPVIVPLTRPIRAVQVSPGGVDPPTSEYFRPLQGRQSVVAGERVKYVIRFEELAVLSVKLWP